MDYVIVNDSAGTENIIVMNKVSFVEINYGITNLIFQACITFLFKFGYYEIIYIWSML